MADYKSSYTGLQVDTAVGKVLDGSLNTHELTLVDNSGTYTLELKGVTQTFEDISTLVSSEGTFTIVNNNGETLIPSFISSTTIRFSNLYNRTDEFDLEVVSISIGDIVTLDNYAAESQINKVETVSSSSTNTQYPSAKCIYDIIAVMTDNGLSNLSKEGDDRLHALKGYLESGRSYADDTLYRDVYQYNHSKFDLSKFTVVGSPIITDDGIASGFSASNYLTKDLNLSGNSLKIRVPFKTTNVAKTQLLISNSNFQLRLIYVSASTALYPSLYVTDGVNTVQPRTSNYSIQANVDYFVEIEYKHNVSVDIKLYSASGVLLDSFYSTSSVNTSAVIPNTTLTTNIGSNASTGYLEGSIDLKAFSITIDGIPVFSGNKTGIDTIKPVDYTVVGTGLTITNDGIASGFSASDYLTKITTISLDKTTYFEFDVKFKTPSSWTKNGRFWAYGTKLYFGHTAIGKLSGAFIGSSITQTGLSALATNTKYNAKFIYDATGFYVKFKKVNETVWTSSTPATVTSTETQTLAGAIGNQYDSTGGYYTGSIDLNSIKFYVNGDLVYQACLLIPYTESSTGSKVVDVVYRDRVIDVYEQFGLANYYTIQENAEINYTVVGTPTISSDYIASGFSEDSYIKTIKLNVLKDKSFKITNRFKITNSSSWIQCPLGDWGHTRMGVFYVVNPQYKEVRFYYQLGDSQSSSSSEYIIVRDGDLGRDFAIGDEYDMYYEFVFPSTLRFGIKKLGSTTWIEKTVTNSDYSGLYAINVYPDSDYQIGKVFDNNTSAIVDLKQFSITSNDELIFEAITKPNATLPMGEVYGFIGNIEKNKVTTISAASTDAQYPSAKCVYTLIGDIETLINAL